MKLFFVHLNQICTLMKTTVISQVKKICNEILFLDRLSSIRYIFNKTTLVMILILICSSLYFMYIFDEKKILPLKLGKRIQLYTNESNPNFLVYTPGCRILKYDPFDITVRRHYSKIPYKYICGPKGSIFGVTKNGIVSMDEKELMKQYHVNKSEIGCVYYPIHRKNSGPKPDDAIQLGKEHKMFFDTPMEDDFILLKCRTGNKTFLTTPLLLTPIKPKVEKRCQTILENTKLPEGSLSVILVGIDSISKLNFLRYFKKTLQLLRKELLAIELNGFVKVADNTYPNLIPLLTGHQRNHYKAKEKKMRYYDDVGFVWKRYAAAGYRTLFSEDAPNMGTFVMNRRGFKNPPTDYYSRPYSIAVEAFQKRHHTHCINSKLEMEVYFEYLQNFLMTIENGLFFSFTFVARLTHDILKYAGYADKPSVKLVTFLKENGVLNRSLLIFFSDHGIRFGDIRRTYIGKIEERMPFIFLLFPDWFLQRHHTFSTNLQINQHRLTTPYDIHATLLHLLDMKRKTFYTLHGQSLFNEIPLERTCADAMISKHWCTCQSHQLASVGDSSVRKSATAVVRKLNLFLKPFHKLCVPLRLNKVLDARVREFNESKEYLLTLMVEPSEAIFEATVQVKESHFRVANDISRIDKYGNESGCVQDSLVIKYCFCKSLLL